MPKGTGNNNNGEVVPTFTTVQIGDVTGQYAQGAWRSRNPDTNLWRWDPDPYFKRVRWQANGMTFEVSSMGRELTQADLIAIAESMK